MNHLYKKILIAFFFSMQFSFLNAQWVNIPDTAFRGWLNNNGYASCMSGIYMDTTCNLILNEDSIYLDALYITNATGIKYFKNLKYLVINGTPLLNILPELPNLLQELNCGNNNIGLIPSLPDSLRILNCYANNLFSLPPLPAVLESLGASDNIFDSLPTLPNSLKFLACQICGLTDLPPLPDALTFIEVTSNGLTSLPDLPDSLRTLICYNNQLSSLPSLPDSLSVLHCGHNQISNLPPLPSSLKTLSCDANQITFLPALPNGLTNLYCDDNQLTGLPTLPDSLDYLSCILNSITVLPSLPDSLTHLDFGGNQVTNIPALPEGLIYLDCSLNPLDSLPVLPNSLQRLLCRMNGLSFLPPLPASLIDLYCWSNQLPGLPSLPSSLKLLDCSSNQLPVLPSLPSSLEYLSCSSNQLSGLPSLPDSLLYLDCRSNQISFLPDFPDSLADIYCANNLISYLPELPDSVHVLFAENNPNLVCLPELKEVVTLRFFGTGITCAFNYGNVNSSNPPINSIPICDIYNQNNCAFYWNINGKIYNDINNNCQTDTGEKVLPNQKVMVYTGGVLVHQSYSDSAGIYKVDIGLGLYDYTIDTTNSPIFVTCPLSGYNNSILTAGDSIDINMDFGMECKPGFDVGVTSIARDSGIFRPANFARMNIYTGDLTNFYGLHCASGISGTVQVVFNGAVSFIGASAGALTPVVSGDTLLYSIADFGTVNFNSDFSFTIQTDTTAVIGSQVCFDITVNPVTGDINAANNTLQQCFTVVGSLDPNTKEVFPEGNIDTSQHWLTYTINFQNNGTAPAQHIYILDTLDNSLDESSFTLLSYSHQPLTQVISKVIRFNFPNINLADSTSDEPHSHGYVQYKVKLKTGLTNGTLIHNTADIIFDFNTPVTTNTTENQILITTGINEFKVQSLKFKVVPNPFHNSTLLKIISPMKSGNYNLEIYNVIGEKMREIKSVNKNEIVIERKNLEAGIYIFKLFDGKELKGTGKMVVQ